MDVPTNITPTGFLRDFQRPKRQLILNAPEDSELPVYVHFLFDKSGSFQRHANALGAAFQSIVEQLLKTRGAENLFFSATEMSGHVVSSPYAPLRDFRAPNIPAGDQSPHAAMLASARKVDAPLIGVPRKASLIRIIACDGLSTDSWEELCAEVDWLKNAQNVDSRFQVFTLQIGDCCNSELLKSFSVNRPQFDIFDYDFSRFVNEIVALVTATIVDPTVPARSLSLREIARPNPRVK